MESGKKTSGDKKAAILLGVVAVLALAVIAQGAMLFRAGCQTGGKGIMGGLMGQMCPLVKRGPEQAGKVQGMSTPLGARSQAASMWGDDFFFGGWDPFREIDQMHQGMNRMFSRTMRKMMSDPGYGLSGTQMSAFEPDIDIGESGDYYVISYDLPGMDKDKINVDIRDQMLTVSGQRGVAEEKEADGFYRMERSFGSFSRSVPLPYDADVNDVKAQYEQGVLKIQIKKIRDAAKPGSASKPVPVV